MLRQILFKCPRTGMHVQHRLEDGRAECAEAEGTHVPVSCPACATLHFVNSSTGKMLGDSGERPVAVRRHT